MPYPDWLKIIQNKNEVIHVDKVRQESIDEGEMAAGSPSTSAHKLTRIIEQRNATTKILVVGDGVFSAELSDYAIKMGQRLDCEIVALSVFDKHCQDHRDPCERETAHFMKRSELGATSFEDKAISGGVKFSQLARIGAREAVIDQAIKEFAGIRYVLSKPDAAKSEAYSDRVQMPVIETSGSK